LKLYQDRADAGRRLAALLTEYADRPDVIVLALPRGGVPVGFEVARVLHAMLDVFLVRKLGLPGYEELAMGAIASGGVIVVNEEVVRQFRIAPGTLEGVAEQELQEMERREAVYRHGRSFPDISGRTVILVDDGLATGSTMRAGVTALRQLEPAAVIVAVPVGAPDTCELLKQSADRVMCAQAPENFSAVGRWYVDFDQTTDDEVCYLLQQGQTEYQHSHTEKEALARK